MRNIPHGIDLDAYIDFIGEQESQFIIKPSMVAADVLDMFAGRGNSNGYVLPWLKTHDNVAIRPGEVSLWAGINGHGKSQILGMVIAWMIPHSNCLIASLEMKTVSTMHRMIRQVSGGGMPTQKFIEDFSIWSDDRLWLYDQLDTVKTERIYGLVNYAAKELGVEQIVIDSLMKCGIPNDDYNGQKSFLDKLSQMAKALNVHIHLVHHMRKRDKEGHKPDKFDVRGAGEIVDMVDNLFIVHRNKDKEANIQAGKEVDENAPDSTLTVAKQRHGEWEGQINLWFHKESQQYTPTPQNRPIPYNFMATEYDDQR